MKVTFALPLFAFTFWVCSLFTVSPSLAFAQGPRAPKVKTGKIKENQQYKSIDGKFSITLPPARNPFVATYKFRESKLKNETDDYEEVVFQIADFGQAYGAGVRRIPQSVLAQMAKEEEKQTLSNLAGRAVFQWRNYAEEPQPVDEAQVQTQFGVGLFRIYVAKHSSLLSAITVSGQGGKPKPERSDARIAVLVVKKGDLFIYATAEDEYLMGGSTPLDLRKQLETFFATMMVKIQE